MTKTMPTMFKAGGESYDALKKAYDGQREAYENLRKFEDFVFGAPGPNDETQIMGVSLRNYGARPNPEWDRDGIFLGFRFDWAPLNRSGGVRYAIPAKPLLPGWTEVPDHPGLYRPDPVMLADLYEEFPSLNLPHYHTLKEVSGAEPIITIQHINGAYPRAYQSWPEIHVDHVDGRLDFYIDVPKDYKGQVFQPPGSTPLSEKEWYEFRNSYGDMYEGSGPRPQGVPLPGDYAAHKGRRGGEDRHYYCLAGESLKIYRQFETDQQKASDASSAFFKALKAGSYSYRGTELNAVEFKTPPGTGWKKLNPSDYGRDMYAPDSATAKGRAVLEGFAALPQRPDLKELQKRLVPNSPEGLFPQAHKFAEYKMTVLEYPAGVKPPPGAQKVPGIVYHWLRQDQMDLACGVQPPPPNAEISNAIRQFLSTLESQRPAPKGPSPF